MASATYTDSIVFDTACVADGSTGFFIPPDDVNSVVFRDVTFQVASDRQISKIPHRFKYVYLNRYPFTEVGFELYDENLNNYLSLRGSNIADLVFLVFTVRKYSCICKHGNQTVDGCGGQIGADCGIVGPLITAVGSTVA